tara:strand:+ start:58 stop:750 length:693 start_codon:yes stop_codon:yes gene_type:complete
MEKGVKIFLLSLLVLATIFIIILGIAINQRTALLSPYELESGEPPLRGCITGEPSINNNCAANAFANWNWQTYENIIDDTDLSTPFSLRALTTMMTGCMASKGYLVPSFGVPDTRQANEDLVECKTKIMREKYKIDETITYHPAIGPSSAFEGNCPQGFFVLDTPRHMVKCEINGYCNSQTGAANIKCHEHPDQGGLIWTASVGFNGVITTTTLPKGNTLIGMDVNGLFH